MLSLGELTQIATDDQVDTQTVERDYVLTHVIGALARHPNGNVFQFKGGTSLRLCYFHEYRYSAEIELVHEPRTQIEFIGPTGSQSPRKIKLDTSDDELVIDTSSTATLINRYADQVSSPTLLTYTLNETLAEMRDAEIAVSRPVRHLEAHRRTGRSLGRCRRLQTKSASQESRSSQIRRRLFTSDGAVSTAVEHVNGSASGCLVSNGPWRRSPRRCRLRGFRMAPHMDALLLDDTSPGCVRRPFTIMEQPETFECLATLRNEPAAPLTQVS